MHDDTTDTELLRLFVEQRDESSFARLVRRHLGLVHSAALRMLGGDAHLAEDVAQSVFTDLARKAASLTSHRALAGWLYTSTHYAAAKIARTESRRRRREETAYAMQDHAEDSPADAAWAQLRPVLDEAMEHLSPADRDAVLLRFFEGRAIGEIALRFGSTKGAARMRVDRALERLRTQLARRGVVSSATALSSVIASHAVAAPPASLASTVATSALAASAAASGGTLALLKILIMSKAKIGLTAATALTGAVLVGVPYVENARLQERLAATPVSLPPSADASGSRRATDANTAAQPETAELERLRNDAAVLRALIQEGRSRVAHRQAAAPVPTVAGERFLDPKDLDGTPRPVKMTEPKYPAEMKAAGIPGSVLVEILIGADGKVVAANPIDATHGAFVDAAVEAILQWEFQPGQLRGTAVGSRVRLPVSFILSDPAWF